MRSFGPRRRDRCGVGAAFIGRSYVRDAWSALEHSVRTGENAFEHVHGTDVWSYRAERPRRVARTFDFAMQSLTGGVNKALVAAYDFGRFRTVVDVGGGNSALLAGLLAAYPELRGVVFDQEHVVEVTPTQAGGAVIAGAPDVSSTPTARKGAEMAQNPPEGYTAVTPYLYYKDSDAALEFITRAFGAKEKFKMAGEDGKVAHAEVEFDGAVVMFGTPGPDYKSPNELGGHTAGTYVYVDDVDAHFEHVKGAGAKITSETKDQFYGDRSFACEDPEGHQWWFATHVKEVPMEEMEAAMASSS